MKKLNIQKDLDSRREISRANNIAQLTESESKNSVTPLIIEQNAQSQNLQECENNPSGSTESVQKTKKRRTP